MFRLFLLCSMCKTLVEPMNNLQNIIRAFSSKIDSLMVCYITKITHLNPPMGELHFRLKSKIFYIMHVCNLNGPNFGIKYIILKHI